jgi:hypothetical protein
MAARAAKQGAIWMEVLWIMSLVVAWQQRGQG